MIHLRRQIAWAAAITIFGIGLGSNRSMAQFQGSRALPPEILEAIEKARAEAGGTAPSEEDEQPDVEQPAGKPDKPKASGPEFSKTEIERLKATWKSLTDVQKEEMKAYYAAMEVKIAQVLGVKEAAQAKAKSLPDEIRALKFERVPAKVLAARSKLGFAPGVMPVMSDTKKAAAWLHMHVLAGEWEVLPEFMAVLSKDDAVAVYSHILRSTNKGGSALLPEEVLAIGDACPDEMEDWQLDVLSQLLRKSSGRYGKQPFLELIQAGTLKFGSKEDEQRARTGRLLVGAGLALEAKDYLSPIEKAREDGDARVIFAHARYFEDLVASGRAPEPEKSALQSWHLLGEVTLMDSAKVDLRKDAMKRAIDRLTEVPPAQASEWLAKVFASPSLGPAALEVVALKALSFRDKKLGAEKRAQGLATMKAAVDTLLSQENLDLHALRVPMRMLTSALADEVDVVVKTKGGKRGVSREAALLFRAAPDERWLSAIEPSVAIRGYKAAVAIATIADETDLALDTLANAIDRFPRSGTEIADEFLKLWIKRLNPTGRNAQDDFFVFYAWRRMPSAPLTRGRQRRNLDRLERLVTLLKPMGISARDLPSVTDAFKACHAKTEVFEEGQIERVFGAVGQVPASAAAALASSMRAGLGGDWRNRQVQQSFGIRRSRAEISLLVEVGYQLAIRLASRARQLEPDSWRHAVLHAAINYDHLRYQQTQKKEDFATYNEVRRQAFSAFEQASHRYASLVSRGLERDDAGVFLTWFAAVLDAGEPVTDDVVAEEEANEDQINRIAAAMQELPEDAYNRHVGAFAREIVSSLGSVPPEKKPTIIRSAVKIVGEHPAGAPLRSQHELYQDLLKDEIRLRLTVDGEDRLAADTLFAVTLTLRYTNSVDRETGGFDKYLYQDAYVLVGGQYRNVNYQDQFRRSIESGFGQSFTVESIGFFEPLTPSRAVQEDGELGWQEKPMAYVLLKANDPSVDRLPPITFDMHFDDQSGPVTLPITSNSPPIDATAKSEQRPIRKLKVDQVVDTRRLEEGKDEREVTLEIHARAHGVIPEVKDLLEGLETALAGYQVDKVEDRPLHVVETDTQSERFGFIRPQKEDKKKEFATADEKGLFRLVTERSWLVTFKPNGDAVGDRFMIPKLKAGLDGELLARHFADMDIVPVEGESIAVTPAWSTGSQVTLGVGSILVLGLLTWLRLRRSDNEDDSQDGFTLPERITPLSTLAALRRMEETAAALNADQRVALADEIAGIERAHFGPNGHVRPDTSQLRDLLHRWADTCR